ncbi:hypothetical protein HJFPF1_06105 [Paramyrothecium foliicola]|nr:hypothetical protein HJFPF1_06105 [Paramyrothecium foliicola]
MKFSLLTILAAIPAIMAVPAPVAEPEPEALAAPAAAPEAEAEALADPGSNKGAGAQPVGKYATYGKYPPPKNGYTSYGDYKNTDGKGYGSYGKALNDKWESVAVHFWRYDDSVSF